MASPLTAAERRELKAQLRGLLADGKSEQACCEELDIGPRMLRTLLGELLASELEGISSETPAQAWVRYRLRMESCLEDLDHVIEKGRENIRALNAVVSAVKAKASLIDAVEKRGQQLGVLPTGPAREDEFDGVPTSEVKTSELRRVAAERLAALQELARQAGGKDYADEPDTPIYN